MGLTRRQLLKRSGLSFGAVLFAGCTIPEEEMVVQSPVRLPEDTVEGFDAFYATTIQEGGSSEGLLVRVMEGRAKKIEGNPDFPLNRGKHSAKSEANLQSLYHPDRIQGPLKRVGPRGTGDFTPISWDEALDTLTMQLKSQQGNPQSVVLMTQPIRGHLGGIAETFITSYGGRHLTHEPIEETVLRQAIASVFGQKRIPAFDIQNSQHILSFGADFLGTWLSPVQFSRQYGEFRQGANRERGTLVQIEPRFSLTAANADEWVPVKPGSEGFLALGIASAIITEGLGDPDGTKEFIEMIGEEILAKYSPESVSETVGITPERIRELAHDFAVNQPSLALGGGSAAGHTNGLFNLVAVYGLNRLVGNLGEKGGVQFNPQFPSASVVDASTASSFSQWLKIGEEMSKGGVQVALVRGINPVYSMPKGSGFSANFTNVPFIASFSSFLDETAMFSDLILPEHVSLEDWGDDVPDPSPGFETLGFQQPVVIPFTDSRGFGDVLLALADELGGPVAASLPWNSLKDVLRSGAKEIYDLNRGSLRASSFEEFWVGILQRGGWWDIDSKKIEVGSAPGPIPEPETPEFFGDPSAYPMHLIPFLSQSIGDGSGAHLPWLQATPDPITTATWRTWVEVNPKNGKELGLREGDVVRVESPSGFIEAQVYIHPATPPGILSIPMGQGHTGYGRYATDRGANLTDLLVPQQDKQTGALAWAATRVRLIKTGGRDRIPKSEGMTVSVPVAGFPVVRITDH